MKNEKTHKFAILKKIAIVIATILIIFSITLFISAYYLAKPIFELEKSKPIIIKVDISKPGVYSGNIEHSEHENFANFGVILYLAHSSDMTFPEIFNNIEGKIETLNDNGEVLTQFELKTESPPHRIGTDDIEGYPPCWILSPFTADQKTLKITVTKPVENLVNSEQIFEGYYLLNGIEYLPAGFAGIWGFIFLGTSLLIILILILVPIYKKNKRNKE